MSLRGCSPVPVPVSGSVLRNRRPLSVGMIGVDGFVMLPGVLYSRAAGADGALDACGAALAVAARTSASAVPAKMLIRALCIDAYSTCRASGARSCVGMRAPTAPRRDAGPDIHS